MNKKTNKAPANDNLTSVILQTFDAISSAKPDLDANTIAMLVQAWATAASATKLHGAIFAFGNSITESLDKIDVAISGIDVDLSGIESAVDNLRP